MPEAHRVLRPSGRLYIDTIALDSPEGWHMLSNNLEQPKNGLEVPYIPIPSTADELIAYFPNAGLEDIRVEQCDSLLMVARGQEFFRRYVSEGRQWLEVTRIGLVPASHRERRAGC